MSVDRLHVRLRLGERGGSRRDEGRMMRLGGGEGRTRPGGKGTWPRLTWTITTCDSTEAPVMLSTNPVLNPPSLSPLGNRHSFQQGPSVRALSHCIMPCATCERSCRARFHSLVHSGPACKGRRGEDGGALGGTLQQ